MALKCCLTLGDCFVYFLTNIPKLSIDPETQYLYVYQYMCKFRLRALAERRKQSTWYR